MTRKDKGPGVVVHLSAEDAALVARAAAAAGLSRREFARRSVVAAARQATGEGAEDLLGMVRQVRDAVCLQSGRMPGEGSAAVAALTHLGMPAKVASARVGRLLAEEPTRTAEGLIALACQTQ